MIPIYMADAGGGRGYSYEALSSDLPGICDDHWKAGRAKAFAFILCDVSSAHVINALRNEAYWRALDTASGRSLSVFYFHTEVTSASQDRMYFMVGVRDIPANDLTVANSAFLKFIGHDRPVPAPAILIFQCKDGLIDGVIPIALDAQTPEQAFNSLHDILKTAAEVVGKQVYGAPAVVIFEGLQKAFMVRRIRARAWQVVKVGKTIAEMLAITKGFAS